MARFVFLVICMALPSLFSVSCLPGELDTRSILIKQQKDLRNLKCEPKPVLVTIKNELHPKDDLADKDYYPVVVSVNRCLKDCSFCGTSVLTGELDRICKPDPKGIVDRPVVLLVLGEGKQNITVKEHTVCRCMYEETIGSAQTL